MKSLRVTYIDTYTGWEYHRCFTYHAISKHFKVQIVTDNPDIVISGGFGNAHFAYDQPKIVASHEINTFNPDYFDICIGTRMENKGQFKPNLSDKYFEMVHPMEYDGYYDLLYHNKRHAIYTPPP